MTSEARSEIRVQPEIPFRLPAWAPREPGTLKEHEPLEREGSLEILEAHPLVMEGFTATTNGQLYVVRDVDLLNRELGNSPDKVPSKQSLFKTSKEIRRDPKPLQARVEIGASRFKTVRDSLPREVQIHLETDGDIEAKKIRCAMLYGFQLDPFIGGAGNRQGSIGLKTTIFKDWTGLGEKTGTPFFFGSIEDSGDDLRGEDGAWWVLAEEEFPHPDKIINYINAIRRQDRIKFLKFFHDSMDRLEGKTPGTTHAAWLREVEQSGGFEAYQAQAEAGLNSKILDSKDH